MALTIYMDEDVTERLTEALLRLGLDVTSVSRLGNKGLKDYEQLLIAAGLNRTLLTYNTEDFELLHGAWRMWSRAWNATTAARHAGILLIHSSKGITVPDIATAVHRFASNPPPMDNRLFAWTSDRDWHEILVPERNDNVRP